MDKSIHSKQYHELLKFLKKEREKAGITQVELAEWLNETQTFVSKYERGERRIDLIETLQICRSIGVSRSKLSKFIGRLKILD